ncbi:MAG: rhomboid family intramembrane serine protease [Flavobacteriales bacterium]|jgi:membrane associated rhomboid family serine protease|nr:rhomboid family intramembrane serine protease [Flavobacteriales bacterium]
MSNFRPTSFSLLPNIIKNIIIINVIVWLYLTSGIDGDFGFSFMDLFALHYWENEHFQIWQPFTYMFMHKDTWHLVMNMFTIWMFGNTLENLWGPKRFLTFYLATGIGAGLFHLIITYFQLQGATDLMEQMYLINVPTIGASGAFFGLLMAYGLTYPNSDIYIYFLFPIKTKYFVTIIGVIELYRGFSGTAGNVAVFAHLGGMLVGFLIMRYWKSRNHLY